MTDTTELAQREKFEAWWERTQHNGNPPRFGWECWREGEGYKVDDDESELDGMWEAWKAAGAELVEALEKAQQHIARQEQIILNQDESLSIRRGELEAAQQERDNWRTSFDNERFRADKLKAHIDDIEPIRAAAEKLVRCKGRYHSELNYRALASLFGVTAPDLPPLDSESSAVTVKLTDINEYLAEVHDKTLNRAFRILAEGVRAGDVAAMRAAGIKVEAE